MKRDMDIIRRIALATADLQQYKKLNRLPDVESHIFCIHAQWMIEAGLVHGEVRIPKEGTGQAAYSVVIWRLTWQGCEFVDAVRDNNLWNKARENVLKPSMSFTFDVLREWLKVQITQGLPSGL